jgi:hypothetical protein
MVEFNEFKLQVEAQKDGEEKAKFFCDYAEGYTELNVFAGDDPAEGLSTVVDSYNSSIAKKEKKANPFFSSLALFLIGMTSIMGVDAVIDSYSTTTSSSTTNLEKKEQVEESSSTYCSSLTTAAQVDMGCDLE